VQFNRLTNLAPAPGIRNLGLNLSPLQPWNSLWLGMNALAPGVCVWGCNTPCPHQMCNPQCYKS